MYHFNVIGAFGVVHKGEMIASDGIAKAVAIKTIKCKFCYCIYMYVIALIDKSSDIIYLVVWLPHFTCS